MICNTTCGKTKVSLTVVQRARAEIFAFHCYTFQYKHRLTMWPCWWCFVGLETQKEFGTASGEVSWRLITTALPRATVGGVIMGTANLATTGCSNRHGFQTAPAINNTNSKSVYRPANCDDAGANYRFVSMESGRLCCQMLQGRAVGTPVSFSGVRGFKFRFWNRLCSLRFFQIGCTVSIRHTWQLYLRIFKNFYSSFRFLSVCFHSRRYCES
jgi:hypothetical protein